MNNYQTQQLVETMVTMMMMAMGVKATIPIMLPQKQKSKTMMLYHATCEHNIPSVLKHGIVPKSPTVCDTMIDNMLSEYGVARTNAPIEIWEPPLERCKSTAGKVFLSVDEDYAKGNCLAGYEVEYELRSKLIAYKYNCPKPSFGEIFGQLYCVTFEVAVPLETIAVNKGRSLEWMKDGERSMATYLYRLHPEWGKEQAEKDAHRHTFNEVELSIVPLTWIQHRSQPYLGKYLYI